MNQHLRSIVFHNMFMVTSLHFTNSNSLCFNALKKGLYLMRLGVDGAVQCGKLQGAKAKWIAILNQSDGALVQFVQLVFYEELIYDARLSIPE
jgi:hypothetical protein